MSAPVFLSDDRVTLRPVTPEYDEFLAKQWNNESIRRLTDRQNPMTERDIREFVEDDVVAFLPVVDDEPVGFAWVFDVDDVNGHAEIGYWIAKHHRGQGYATETVSLLAEWAFCDRHLHRLQARVFDGNGGSVRVLEKVGFEPEGTIREAYKVAGEYVDTTLFGLLAHEW